MKIAKVFDNAQLYKLFQFGVIKPKTSEKIRDEVFKSVGVKSVLDFGCGVGHHSLEFAHSRYLGVEPLEGCVSKANRMFKAPNVKFIVGDHLTLKSIPDSSFQVVIAIGVLHHIDNETFSDFVKEAYRILEPGGRLTTFDPVFHDNQSFTSKWVVSRDRGNWVRTTEDYLSPLKKVFENKVSCKIYKGLLRIPYDHFHMEVMK